MTVRSMVDELNRAIDLLKLQDDNGITEIEELIEDIRLDLDRYYDVADSINACVEGVEI